MTLPTIPEVPRDLPQGLYRLLSAMKEAHEVGKGLRGKADDKTVTEGRLVELGVTTASGESTDLGEAAYLDVGTTSGTVASGADARFFTVAQVQAIIGAILTDTPSISLDYDPSVPSISATFNASGIPHNDIDFIDGGETGFRGHLTSAQHTFLTSNDPETVPDLIDTGEEFTISARRQLVVYGAIDVTGTLTIEHGGKLVVL